MYSSAVNDDAGARVVSDRVKSAEIDLGAYVVGGCFAGATGTALVALSDGTAATVTPSAFESSKPVIHELPEICLTAMADADGAGLLMGLANGELAMLRADGAPETLATVNKGWIERLAVHTPTGRRACSVKRTVYVVALDGDVFAAFGDHASTPTGLAFSPDGNCLAASRYDGVSVWDLQTGALAQDLSWHGSHTAVTWSPDGKFIVTAMQDKELHCWRVSDGKSMRMSGYPAKIRSLSWAMNGQYLCVSGADVVTSWDFGGNGPSGKPPLELGYVYNGIAVQVAAHPEEPWVAAGYDGGSVLVGHIVAGDAVLTRPPGGGAISALSWSADGTQLLVGTADGAVSRIEASETAPGLLTLSS